MQYEIIQSQRLESLEKEVQDKVEIGWQPLGPATPINWGGSAVTFMQTIVKGMETRVRGPDWTGGPR
jgi:hypothetical protein